MGQLPKTFAVRLKAIVTSQPASVTLSWANDSNTTGTHTVYKRTPGTAAWSQPLATLSVGVNQYTDATVVAGNSYEYFVQRIDTGNKVANGYIQAGIDYKPSTNRNNVLLLIDENYEGPLASEINQLKEDLTSEGWRVLTSVVNRNQSVTAVKAIISGVRASRGLQAVYLLGRIAVPYSGAFKAVQGNPFPPDGHSEHGGAWPADVYYACFNESVWTDVSVDDATPARVQNRNMPGDGKFDLVSLFLNDEAVVQVGRVDFTQLPLLGNDTILTKQYLQKVHAYKTGTLLLSQRGIIDDNLGKLGNEVFTPATWSSFSALFGDSITEGDYLTENKKIPYAFSHGCGFGSYTSANGIAQTAQFANDSIKHGFTFLFGSYFGDWDSENNLLRAALASKNGGLASAWSGRPYWHVHPMAMGATIGSCAQQIQNNIQYTDNGTIVGMVTNFSPTFIHVALMGDPTLRLHPRQAVLNVRATTNQDSTVNTITWNKVQGVEGYLLRKGNGSVLLTANDSQWIDLTPPASYTTYIVQPVWRQVTPSGSYFNYGMGGYDSAFAKNGTLSSASISAPIKFLQAYPNPAKGDITLSSDAPLGTVTVWDLLGKELIRLNTTESSVKLNILELKPGIYIVRTVDGDKQGSMKIQID